MHAFDPVLEAQWRFAVTSVTLDVDNEIDIWCEVATLAEAEARMFDLLERYAYNREFAIIDQQTNEELVCVSTLLRPF